jgi:translocator protein
MGFASWRVFHFGKDGRSKIPLIVYTIKLLINYSWVIVAFGFGSLLGANIVNVILLMFVASTGVLFFKIDRLAGIIFIPYFLYLSYVQVLLGHIYYLNYIDNK